MEHFASFLRRFGLRSSQDDNPSKAGDKASKNAAAGNVEKTLGDLREQRPVPWSLLGMVAALLAAAVLGLAWHHYSWQPHPRSELSAQTREALERHDSEFSQAAPSSMLEVAMEEEDHSEGTEEEFHQSLDKLFATAQIELGQVVNFSTPSAMSSNVEVAEAHDQLKKLVEDHVEMHSLAMKSELLNAVGEFTKLHTEAKQIGSQATLPAAASLLEEKSTTEAQEVRSRLMAAQGELSSTTEELLAMLQKSPDEVPPGFDGEVHSKLAKLMNQTTATMALQDGLQEKAQLGHSSAEANATRDEAKQRLLELEGELARMQGGSTP